MISLLFLYNIVVFKNTGVLLNGYKRNRILRDEVFHTLKGKKMELIRKNVKVEWVELGEGWNGDYDPKNPEDEKLLRFDVYVFVDREWEMKDDASYCTRFPVKATDEQKQKGPQLILDEFYDALSSDIACSVKKLGERMSWIGLDWIKS